MNHIHLAGIGIFWSANLGISGFPAASGGIPAVLGGEPRESGFPRSFGRNPRSFLVGKPRDIRFPRCFGRDPRGFVRRTSGYRFPPAASGGIPAVSCGESRELGFSHGFGRIPRGLATFSAQPLLTVPPGPEDAVQLRHSPAPPPTALGPGDRSSLRHSLAPAARGRSPIAYSPGLAILNNCANLGILGK